jgi:catalase
MWPPVTCCPSRNSSDLRRPILLQDHYPIEQMANFNRERIPERQPHAKRGGAFGRFETTGDVSAYTKAALFQPGTRTDLLIRFSTVAGERGSPDTWRDPARVRGQVLHARRQLRHGRNNTPVFAPNSKGGPARCPARVAATRVRVPERSS